MTRACAILAAVLALGLVPAVAEEAKCSQPEGALELVPQDGAPGDVFVVLAAPKVSVPVSARVTLCGNAARDAVDVQFDADMPAHRHGMNYVAQVTEAASGEFDVGGLVFHMPGIWRLKVAVRRGEKLERYTGEVAVR